MYTIDRDTIVGGPITVGSNSATNGGIPFSTSSGAGLMIESSSAGSVTLTFYAKRSMADSSLYRLVDSTGAPITRVVDAGDFCQLPTEMFAGLFVVPVASSGTVTAYYCMKG